MSSINNNQAGTSAQHAVEASAQLHQASDGSSCFNPGLAPMGRLDLRSVRELEGQELLLFLQATIERANRHYSFAANLDTWKGTRKGFNKKILSNPRELHLQRYYRSLLTLSAISNTAVKAMGKLDCSLLAAGSKASDVCPNFVERGWTSSAYIDWKQFQDNSQVEYNYPSHETLGTLTQTYGEERAMEIVETIWNEDLGRKVSQGQNPVSYLALAKWVNTVRSNKVWQSLLNGFAASRLGAAQLVSAYQGAAPSSQARHFHRAFIASTLGLSLEQFMEIQGSQDKELTVTTTHTDALKLARQNFVAELRVVDGLQPGTEAHKEALRFLAESAEVLTEALHFLMYKGGLKGLQKENILSEAARIMQAIKQSTLASDRGLQMLLRVALALRERGFGENDGNVSFHIQLQLLGKGLLRSASLEEFEQILGDNKAVLGSIAEFSTAVLDGKGLDQLIALRVEKRVESTLRRMEQSLNFRLRRENDSAKQAELKTQLANLQSKRDEVRAGIDKQQLVAELRVELSNVLESSYTILGALLIHLDSLGAKAKAKPERVNKLKDQFFAILEASRQLEGKATPTTASQSSDVSSPTKPVLKHYAEQLYVAIETMKKINKGLAAQQVLLDQGKFAEFAKALRSGMGEYHATLKAMFKSLNSAHLYLIEAYARRCGDKVTLNLVGTFRYYVERFFVEGEIPSLKATDRAAFGLITGYLGQEDPEMMKKQRASGNPQSALLAMEQLFVQLEKAGNSKERAQLFGHAYRRLRDFKALYPRARDDYQTYLKRLKQAFAYMGTLQPHYKVLADGKAPRFTPLAFFGRPLLFKTYEDFDSFFTSIRSTRRSLKEVMRYLTGDNGSIAGVGELVWPEDAISKQVSIRH